MTRTPTQLVQELSRLALALDDMHDDIAECLARTGDEADYPAAVRGLRAVLDHVRSVRDGVAWSKGCPGRGYSHADPGTVYCEECRP